METATALLIGQKLNVTVQLLGQVKSKLSAVFSSLPLQAVDHTKATPPHSLLSSQQLERFQIFIINLSCLQES